jgi:AAA family ATP:ADP antiporter
MISPALVAVGFACLAASPMPILLAVIQVVHRAGNFALIAPARESLYTQVDRESRYKAKAFIDTAIYRGGDVVVGWGMAGVAAIGLSLGQVGLLGLVVATAWALLGLWVGRTYSTIPPGAAPSAATSATTVP